MLTQQQEDFIAKIPEDAVASIAPWDRQAATYAEQLAKKIEGLGLEVFWEGFLALGIAGENDIDMYIFSSSKDFGAFLPGIIQMLGEPTYTLSEKILWRIKKDRYKIDAGLADKKNPDVVKDMFFFNSLKSNPLLLKEYADIKKPGLSAREYYRQKNEFYNKITDHR